MYGVNTQRKIEQKSVAWLRCDDVAGGVEEGLVLAFLLVCLQALALYFFLSRFA